VRALVWTSALAFVTASTALPQAREWRQSMDQGNAAEAAGDYQKAVDSFRDAARFAGQFDRKDMRRVLAWDGLATMSDALGRLTDAEDYYRRALEAAEQAGGKSSAVYGFVLARLGTLYASMGQTGKGEKVLRTALAIERTSGADELKIAMAQDCLAEVLSFAGKYDEARSLLTSSLAIFEKLPNNWNEDSIALNELAVLSYHRGSYADAEQMLRRSLTLAESHAGPEHPMLARPLNDLATVLAAEGRIEEAGAVFRRAMGIAEMHLGAQTRVYGRLLANYAACLRLAGDKTQAKLLEAQAREILRDSDRRNGLGAVVDISELRRQ
jgi:tetratricopeptide (TPR) repeat protein